MISTEFQGISRAFRGFQVIPGEFHGLLGAFLGASGGFGGPRAINLEDLKGLHRHSMGYQGRPRSITEVFYGIF